jgi:two-component sensor histidine kinase
VPIIGTEIHAKAIDRTGAWLYLDEVMHRVINDYSAMLSIVRLASSKVSDPESGKALNDLMQRLSAGATFFRALSPPFDPSPRHLDLELGEVCGALTASILAENAIRLKFSADCVCVNAQKCWKICLVVSELITNAAKHAFHGREEGSIVVELSTWEGTIHCAVIDDGSAPAMIAPGRGSSIVEAITAELGGTIVRNYTSRGSAVVLLVPHSEFVVHLGQCS